MSEVSVVDGEHRGDGRAASRRRGRHAAPAVGGRASTRRVLIVAATAVTIAVLGGAIAANSFAGAPQALDATADIVSASRPTSTDPAAPASYAPILPSPGAPPSASPGNPGSPRDDLAPTATAAPTDPPTEPTPIAEPGRETPPPETSAPGPTSPPDETTAPDDSEDPAAPEQCVERRGFFEILFLGPSCP